MEVLIQIDASAFFQIVAVSLMRQSKQCIIERIKKYARTTLDRASNAYLQYQFFIATIVTIEQNEQDDAAFNYKVARHSLHHIREFLDFNRNLVNLFSQYEKTASKALYKTDHAILAEEQIL